MSFSGISRRNKVWESLDGEVEAERPLQEVRLEREDRAGDVLAGFGEDDLMVSALSDRQGRRAVDDQLFEGRLLGEKGDFQPGIFFQDVDVELGGDRVPFSPFFRNRRPW